MRHDHDGATGLIEWTVCDADDEGARADVVLGRRVEGLSRRVAKTMAMRGALTIDGRKAAASRRVRQGMTLRLHLRPAAEPPAITVLATTADFVYVDKPAGLHTHRLGPDDPPTLGDAVVALHPECAEAGADARQAGAVHRLDGGTSGVVAFARHRDAWLAARQAFGTQPGAVVKVYLALTTAPPTWPVPGLLPTGEPPPWPAVHEPGLRIRARLGPDGSTRVRTTASGRPADTSVWPLARLSSGHWLWAVRLWTGHRHQARVHLSSIGAPILGDPAYGGPPAELMTLHAAYLDLGPAIAGEHPVRSPRVPWADLVDPPHGALAAPSTHGSDPPPDR